MKNQSSKSIKDIGEFGLIDRIQKLLPAHSSTEIIIGIGDDTAVVRLDDNRSLLATCDIMVEGTHFRFDYITPYQLGRRAVSINLSDIASMGGKPTYALISLALPEKLSPDDFDELYSGMSDQMADFSAVIIGGNLAQTSENMVIDIFMLGEIEPDKMLTRSGAEPGDRIMVTGELGASAAGLHVLEKYGLSYPERLDHLVQAHLQPEPRIDEGRLIAASGYATSMIDLSDGLGSDLRHILEKSGVGAEIYMEKLPQPEYITEAAQLVSRSTWDIVIKGGEDYELLFTVKPDTPDEIIENISRTTSTPVTEIGRILPEIDGCSIVDSKGDRHPLETKGWDHFDRVLTK
ncbi:thiamine-phosphate kinase [bacterium]|nr:thiamine-phosphate kinase [bacterium]